MPKIHFYQTVESTNLEARNHFSGAQNGDAWLADSQTGGRGRRHGGGTFRSWFSPPEKNIYLSIVAKHHIPPQEAPFITLATGAAVVNTLTDLFGAIPNLWLKWPNDIYVGRKKLAGILTEGIFDGSEFSGAIIGVGLNILKVDSLPEEIRDLATSLEESLETKLDQNSTQYRHPLLQHDRLSIALSLQKGITAAVQHLAKNGFSSIYSTICKYDRSLDKEVEVTHHGHNVTGIAKGVTPDGKLAVLLPTGETIEVSSGEAKFKLNN